MAGYVPQQFHLVPGRLRLKIASIKGNEARAKIAETQLRKVGGVRDASANKLTGSLIVRFDPAIVSVETLFDALEKSDLIDSGSLPAVRSSTQPVLASTPLADAVISKAVEAILERCALALIAGVI